MHIEIWNIGKLKIFELRAFGVGPGVLRDIASWQPDKGEIGFGRMQVRLVDGIWMVSTAASTSQYEEWKKMKRLQKDEAQA